MKHLLSLAAAAVLSAGAASAAHPFSDVPPSHWAYQAVSDLADQGLLEGYPDGAFRGDRPITRYEMAQITARLLAQEDRYSPAERETIGALAAEYAPELANLGVRVSALENRVGSLTWRGEARTAYQKWTANRDNGKNHVRTIRLRLLMDGEVNDATHVYGRLTTGDVDLESGDEGDLSMDRLYVRHTLGPAALTLGRYELDMGTQGDWLYGNAFDGAELSADLGGRWHAAVGAGRFRDAARSQYHAANIHDNAGRVPEGDAFGDADAFYLRAEGDFGAFTAGADYYHTASYTTESGARTKSSVYGLHARLPLDDLRVFGDYYKDTDGPGDPAIWTVGAGYGQADPKKRWSFAVDLSYFDVDAGLYHRNMTGLDIDDAPFLTSGHFWLATGTLIVNHNVDMHAEYAFGQDSDHGRDTGDTWMITTRYHF